MRGPAAAIALCAAACGGAPGAGLAEDATFIAFERDFQAFRSWEAFPVAAAPNAASVHLNGPRTEYLSRRPTAESRDKGSFPVGTIVVKEIESSAVLAERVIFAMVKRGGAYNLTGAAGWEWFELQNRADGSVAILWRGVGPPSGVCSYGSAADGGCNDCHRGSAANDFVHPEGLDLAQLVGPPGGP